MTRKKKAEPSRGVRLRLGRTAADIARAKTKRRGYDVDEPENFTECALAECLGKMTGAEVLVMRRYAFVALPGEQYSWRYQLDTLTADIVKANDAQRLGEVHANAPVHFKPPTPGRRLSAQGGKRVSKKSRGILANPPRPSAGDPYRGVYRNGVHANG
jgi:hypothetical protein